MNRHLLVSAAAVAMLGLGVQGCTKKDQAATSNAADATASATSNAASDTAAATQNAGDATANAIGSSNTLSAAEGSGPVSDAQDAASAGVGLASAALPKSPQDFVTAAAISDMYEIQASKLAETKADGAAIKTFAKQMVTDHTKTSAELKAAAKGLTIPTKLDQRRQGLLDNLKSSKDGHEFDKRYVNQQVSSHREAAELMKGYAEHGDNAALKAVAAKAAPIVQHHLDMAKALDATPHNAGVPGANDPAGGKG